MEDSDDEVLFVEEIGSAPDRGTKQWKWKAPNPRVKSGAAQKILQNVRAKLGMDNSSTTLAGCDIQGDAQNKISQEKTLESLYNDEAPSEPETTPKKSLSKDASMSLTPEQIQELTENCLDSDNEPSMTVEESIKNPSSPGPKRALEFSVRASNSLRNRPSKFFGAGTSKEEVDEILNQENGSQSRIVSPSKSPASKKKRLSKESPIRLLPSHMNLGKSPGKRNPSNLSPGKRYPSDLSPEKRSPSFLSPEKRSSAFKSLTTSPESIGAQKELIPEGPYYYEAFSFMVKKIYNNDGYKHLFLETELKKMGEIDKSRAEFQLYVRLMNRKDKWNRCCDISYNDISLDLSSHFDFLECHGLISCDLSFENMDVLLQLLKKDELKLICSQFKIKKSGNKQELVQALLSMHRTQSTISGTNPLLESAVSLLGRCVRLTVEWRLVFRRCILLFAMFHSFEDLDKLCSEQALLLLQVKLGRMVYPLNDLEINQSIQIFSHRDQLIRYEEANVLKQEINNAREIKNHNAVKDLTEKCMKQFQTLLQLKHETSHVHQLPPFLQRYSAGSTYARTLTYSIDALKQGQNYDLALDVVHLLMSQNEYCTHLKGDWALKLSTLLHVNKKDTIKACKVLCAALTEKSLNPVDRMHLQERAEKVFKLKKNGLPKNYKDQLGKVMDPPCKAPEVVEISARAMLGSKPGLKKVYIRDTQNGKEFMSVEETVIAHYRSLGFINGIHDEGSTISSLCQLALWNFIYDPSIPSVFQSPYQIKPLDWGSKTFYERRKVEIEDYFRQLLCNSVENISEELSNLRAKYSHITCLVNWDRLERLNILSFLKSVTIPVFIAISRRLMEDWKSHRKGFPDLILWNPSLEKCLFIEVKSPNDSLSTVQSLWLNFLRKCNAQAFVVHIKESGSKMKK